MNKNITALILVNDHIENVFSNLHKLLKEEGFSDSDLIWPTHMFLQRGKTGLFLTSIKDCKTVLKTSLQKIPEGVEVSLEYDIDIGLGTFTPNDKQTIDNEILKIRYVLEKASKFPNKKILVVDDATHILELIKDILESKNYIINIASNGAEGLDKFSKWKPDLVTLDLSMPIIDGYETLIRIRKIDPSAKVIVLSALENKELIKRCLEKGALGYLNKPFNKDQLLATVNKAFEEIDYDKDISTMFIFLTDKIESVIKKILDPNASLVFYGIQTIKQETLEHDYSKAGMYHRIENIPHIPEKLEITIPEDEIYYVSEITGHQNGYILSCIRENDIQNLFVNNGKSKESPEVTEFFSIINMKVLSELANSTNVIINSTPTTIYDIRQHRLDPSREVSKAAFRITIKEKTIPFEIQLWLNMKELFRRQFKI